MVLNFLRAACPTGTESDSETTEPCSCGAEYMITGAHRTQSFRKILGSFSIQWDVVYMAEVA